MTAVASFWVACPACSAQFEVDPAKVPAEGVHAICSSCARTFLVGVPDAPEREEWSPDPSAALESEALPAVDVSDEPEWETVADVPAAVETTAEPPAFEDLSSFVSDATVEEDAEAGKDVAGKTLSEGANRFGRRDPGDRARRLARVLVSDIIAYHPERYRNALAAGTLKEELADEVDRSWEEYVQQVGLELAESTPYFTEALNEVLAKGDEVF